MAWHLLGFIGEPFRCKDDVQYCLNYAEVSQFILDYVQAKPFLLIERVAYEVAEQLQQRFGNFMVTPQIKQTESGCSSK